MALIGGFSATTFFRVSNWLLQMRGHPSLDNSFAGKRLLFHYDGHNRRPGASALAKAIRHRWQRRRANARLREIVEMMKEE